MKVILLGGSGEVGRAVARALVESEVCSHFTLLGRVWGRTVSAQN